MGNRSLVVSGSNDNDLLLLICYCAIVPCVWVICLLVFISQLLLRPFFPVFLSPCYFWCLIALYGDVWRRRLLFTSPLILCLCVCVYRTRADSLTHREKERWRPRALFGYRSIYVNTFTNLPTLCHLSLSISFSTFSIERKVQVSAELSSCSRIQLLLLPPS